MGSLRVIFGAALVLFLLLSLLVSAPARLLQLVLPADQIIMQGLAGTLWQGSASRALFRLPGGYLHLGAVQWSLQPSSLLLLSPRLRLESKWGAQTIDADIQISSMDDITVRDMDGRVPTSLLQQFAPLALSGQFAVQLSEFSLRDGLPYSGQGRLVWEQGAWESPQGPVALGSYALEFEQEPGEALNGTVLTISGPLNANGKVLLEGRHYDLNIKVHSEEALDPQLEQALTLMAAPEGDGYRLSLEGDF